MFKYLGVFALLFSSMTIQAAKEIPIEAFAKWSEIRSLEISPTGDYLSAKTTRDGKDLLIVLDRRSMKVINVVQFDGDSEQVGSYYWVSSERIVIQKTYQRGANAQPAYYGELLGVNADGSKSQYLMGYLGSGKSFGASGKAKAINATSYVLDPLRGDDEHFLATVVPWLSKSGADRHNTVYKVNAYTGKRRKVTRSPAFNAQYLTDQQGEVRISVSSKDYIDQQIFVRNVETGDWNEFKTELDHLSNISPRAFSKDNKSILALASESGDPFGLYRINLTDNSIKLISKDGTVNPKRIFSDVTDNTIYAVEYENGYPTYEFVDKESLLTKRLKGLIQALPGHQVSIASASWDNKYQIIAAYNDRNPGDYYLMHVDEKTGKPKLQYLMSGRNWIDPDNMSETQPVTFYARDGMEINGYLTIPNGAQAKDLPLIVMPHGGPHGPRDWWGYDPTAQLLASRGMAVLKVNFRGSGGYGPNFESSGHGKWGAEIQYDIIDGTKYLIENGMVDKDNICIMGASFGGYSALQSPIIEPDMFKCAVGVIGVYDLPLMFSEGDVQERGSGMKYLKAVLGEDVEKQKAMSPSYNIDKLKAPVLIVHGGKDRRAPEEQADSLIEALDKEEHPYEYLLFKKEGHGFYKVENRIKYFKRVLKFLDEHLEL